MRKYRAGRIVRSGPCSSIFSDHALRDTETSGRQFEAASRTCFLTEIRHGGELVGSIGMSATSLSAPVILSVAQSVGLGLARLHAIEKTTEVEVLRRSEELKSAVLDAMAHEIRNPLNSAKLAATTLLSGSESFARFPSVASSDIWLDTKIIGPGDRWNQSPLPLGSGSLTSGFQGRSPWLFIVCGHARYLRPICWPGPCHPAPPA